MVDNTPSEPLPRWQGSGVYEIQVQGTAEQHWATELRMQLSYDDSERGTISIFRGHLPDQSALLGALQWLSMWGYLIILVRHIPSPQ